MSCLEFSPRAFRQSAAPASRMAASRSAEPPEAPLIPAASSSSPPHMNPCKCGYYGHPTRTCTCSPSAVRQYRSRVSGPLLLDRIDLCVEMDPVAFDELHGAAPSESSAELRKQVLAAGPSGPAVRCSRLRGCALQRPAHRRAGAARLPHDFPCRRTAPAGLLRDALGLSARAHDRILRVARTIADLRQTAARRGLSLEAPAVPGTGKSGSIKSSFRL